MGGRDCLALKIVPGSQNKKLSLQTGGTGPSGKGTTEMLTLCCSKQQPETALPDTSPSESGEGFCDGK